MAGSAAPKPDGDVLLQVGGKRIEGLERFELHAPAEGLPRSFIWTVSRNPATAAALKPHSAFKVLFGGDLVMTGWTDRVMATYDKSMHSVSVIGRGLCEIIVDCPVNVFQTGWAIQAKTIGQAARIICKPFNIEVVLPGGDVELPESMQIFAVFPGYPAYAMLEEYTRSVGLLMFENEKGQLVLTTGGAGDGSGIAAASGVTEGVNAERVESMLSADERFDKYYVLSFNRSLLDVGDAIVAQAKDPESPFLDPRLRIIPQEFPDVSLDFSMRRAQWESNRRFGRSRLVRATVTGWRDGQGQLWRPNTNVSVNLPAADINDERRTITEVVYYRDERGIRTILSLMPPQALLVQPFTVPVLP
jgi:prophage tail gpP-like protein